MRRSFEVIIVGAGPAGSAAALQIASRDPALAARTLLLDAHGFPREKLCGGGLVRESDRLLSHLGISNGFRTVPVREIRFEYPGGRSVHRAAQHFRVVHRAEFDHALFLAARERGVRACDGEAVQHLERDGDRIALRTRSGDWLETRVLIGADGARSRVRRSLVGSVRTDRFVALEALTPGHDANNGDISDTAVFDFRPASTGLRGYSWAFPSLRAGEPWTSRGLGAATRSSDASLRGVFERSLHAHGVERDRVVIQGAGAPLYSPERPQSAERVLLAGDAVGIDPWFGEGISVALGTGIIAAHTAMEALASGRFGFEGYGRRLEESAVGWSLNRKRLLAAAFYPAARTPNGMARFLGEKVNH